MSFGPRTVRRGRWVPLKLVLPVHAPRFPRLLRSSTASSSTTSGRDHRSGGRSPCATCWPLSELARAAAANAASPSRCWQALSWPLQSSAAGLVSGSVALLAEAGHSAADFVNELLLGLSLRNARRPADGVDHSRHARHAQGTRPRCPSVTTTRPNEHGRQQRSTPCPKRNARRSERSTRAKGSRGTRWSGWWTPSRPTATAGWPR